jgi:hypothetical protein
MLPVPVRVYTTAVLAGAARGGGTSYAGFARMRDPQGLEHDIATCTGVSVWRASRVLPGCQRSGVSGAA